MDELENFVDNAFSLVMSGYYSTSEHRKRPLLSLRSSLLDDRRIPVIAEFKRRTPSVRELSSNVSIHQRLGEFVSEGVCGLSVLTEPHRFDGSLENLVIASDFGVPLLMKDFIISTDQLDAAYRSGADAALLILDIFETTRYSIEVLMEHAHSLGLEVVLEVNSVEQFERAKRSEADIIGINNRDMRSLVLEDGRCERVLASVEKDRPVIGMSGIDTVERALSILDAGADAVLIGTSLMGGDIGLLRKLRGALKERHR
ncbi:MAG: indole-3-glycerol-phosphate synthase [Thermoplasmata archaeon]|uniref:indole-3-glycerol-phosphate synthase n=1 Tax=Candidatus Sysuiplasma superficiale TaxID=2823368 RepID=A0A8J7YWT5_9ARCH|nr:indole-3-glycerol-phosphate synthase [Candidatus Sysuiplasma superficiale]MBX8643851.1 indole-3-glycerol-phosphate synthase [Candidatus Sysuiplasma superficiale]MCL4346661.1 indole-3-glycerol-phosphate synthase [Candidatus Thermoplasmatota archaeon]